MRNCKIESLNYDHAIFFILACHVSFSLLLADFFTYFKSNEDTEASLKDSLAVCLFFLDDFTLLCLFRQVILVSG